MKNTHKNVWAPWCAILFLVVVTWQPALAATKTWDGGGAPDGNWSNGLNWDNNTAPVAGDSLVFAGSTQTATTNDFTADTIFLNVAFDSSAGGFTLSGNELLLTNGVTLSNPDGVDTASGNAAGGSITNFSANTETINLAVKLSPGNHNFTTASGAAGLNFNGTVSRQKAAGATFSMLGGNINFNPSTGLANVNGILGGWAITGNNWASLDGSGNVVAFSSYTDVSTGTLASDATANYRFISDTTSFTNVSGGLFNTVLGQLTTGLRTNVITGTAKASPNGGIWGRNELSTQSLVIGLATSTLTVNGGGELNLLARPFTSNGGGMTVQAIIANDGANPVSVNVRGNVTFNSGARTYSGGTYIYQNGRVNCNASSGNVGTGPVYIFPGGNFLAPNSNNSNVTNDFNVSGVGFEVSGGQVIGAIRFANNTGVQLSGTINLLGDTRVSANVTNVQGIFNSDTLSGKITGLGQLEVVSGTQVNPAFMTIGNANNDWRGGLKVTAGVATRAIQLLLGNNNVIPDGVNAGNVTLNAAADQVWFNLNGKSDTINGLISAGTASNIIITNGTTTASTLTVGNNNATATFAGNILGSSINPVAFAKTGTGTQTLTGNNTYQGNTTVGAGTLALSGSGSIANSANIVVAGGATFDVSGLSSAFNLGSSQTLSNNTSTAVLNVGANGVNTGSGAVSLTYASGTPSFTVTNGTVTLSSSTVVKVNNTGSALAVGNYKLISKATSGNTGSVAGSVPSTVTVTGGGIGAGTAASLQITSGELYLAVSSTAPPKFSAISLSGTTLSLSATNGSAGANVTLLQSTNLAIPLSQWITNRVLTLDGSGNINTNLTGVATNSQTYYILKQ